MNKRIFLMAVTILTALVPVLAQGDQYDNSGKIYTVVAVVCITLFGIAAFLIYLERRIKILENTINDEHRSN